MVLLYTKGVLVRALVVVIALEMVILVLLLNWRELSPVAALMRMLVPLLRLVFSFQYNNMVFGYMCSSLVPSPHPQGGKQSGTHRELS